MCVVLDWLLHNFCIVEGFKSCPPERELYKHKTDSSSENQRKTCEPSLFFFWYPLLSCRFVFMPNNQRLLFGIGFYMDDAFCFHLNVCYSGGLLRYHPIQLLHNPLVFLRKLKLTIRKEENLNLFFYRSS